MNDLLIALILDYIVGGVLFMVDVFKWLITFVVVILILLVHTLLLYWWLFTKLLQPETVEAFADWIGVITDKFFDWIYPNGS